MPLRRVPGAKKMPDRFAVERYPRRMRGKIEHDLRQPRDVCQFAFVFEIGVSPQRRQSDRAIHRAGVQKIKSKVSRNGLRDC